MQLYVIISVYEKNRKCRVSYSNRIYIIFKDFWTFWCTLEKFNVGGIQILVDDLDSMDQPSFRYFYCDIKMYE